MDNQYDVVMVGGGLAGCAAAITLANAGAHVALLEAGDYPRHRVCGEFLSPESLADFDALGVRAAVESHRPPRMNAVRVTTPGGTMWEAPLTGEAVGLSRYTLDGLLADRAQNTGADLFTNTRATALYGQPDAFEIETKSHGQTGRLSARAVILTHGKRAALDRTLHRPFTPRHYHHIGLKMHFDGPPIPGRVEMHSFPGGYIGLNEIEGGAVNACLLGLEDDLRREGNPQAYAEWIAAQNPAFGAWFADATPRLPRWVSIAQVAFSHKQPIVAGAIATGDAAGLIAPLAGDGMAMALAGGRLAAYHTLDALRGVTTFKEAAAAYSADWRSRFGLRLTVGRFLQGWMLRPGMLDLGLHILNTLPALGRSFVANTRGSALPQPTET